MSKKKNRAAAAARGTAADPTAAGRELRREAQRQTANSRKLVGVMPERMADEVKASSDTYPFTFKSAFILAGAALLGTIVIPFFATQAGGTIGFATTAALPPAAGGCPGVHAVFCRFRSRFDAWVFHHACGRVARAVCYLLASVLSGHHALAFAHPYHIVRT